MFWADRIAKQIIESGSYKPYWVDDMFTPSGFAHIGSLRGPLVHDIIYRALKDANQSVTYTYVFNDFDPIDGLPPELEKNFTKYLGFPSRTAPSPDGKAESFAHYFSNDYKTVLNNLGVGAKYLSSWDMYHEGKFNKVIKIALDNSEKIQDIYQQVSGSKKREKGWLPLQVVCEKCGKLGTTRVHKWDGEMVEYICEPNMVKWAVGCEYSGKISPYDGHGKLPWKVDWPAHWKVMGVTIEGAGKDHSSAGGSRDIARSLCKEVFQTPDPFNLPYEFFLIGGKKMSSSKGLGSSSREVSETIPPYLGRFLFTRTDYRQAIEFDPVGTMAIPDLFDEYDRCWSAYNEYGNPDLSRAFELAQIDTVLKIKKNLFIPRFRDIVTFVQSIPHQKIQEKFEDEKGDKLTFTELQILRERIDYSALWISQYAPGEFRFKLDSIKPVGSIELSLNQKKFLKEIPQILDTNNIGELNLSLYRKAKEINLSSKEAFRAIYRALIGKDYGPRAAWLLISSQKDEVVRRIQSALSDDKEEKTNISIKTIQRPDLFTVDPKVKKKYASVSIGIAIIKDVRIEKTNVSLEKEKAKYLRSLKQLTTENISKYPEILSYRKLYRQMGMDWHSRRPSPEALMRRVALGKGLYTVNTCVDAYNLIVMKHRVSVGAFDADQIRFPTVLRFAGEGDEILLLGDQEPTKYTAKELAYYDQKGGYNIDFNYRDAQRTMVTEGTKNIWINVDGVYNITPEQVYRSLTESVEMIVKYCGGSVELEGVVQ